MFGTLSIRLGVLGRIFSVVPATLIGELEKVEGVSEVWSLTSRTTLVDINGKKNSLILVGYQPGGIGGPWKMAEGSSEPGQGGIVADKVTMKTNDLDVVYTYTHEGRVFYFSSEEDRHNFMEEPDKYS